MYVLIMLEEHDSLVFPTEGNSKMLDLTHGLEIGVAYCNAEWDCPQVVPNGDGTVTFFEAKVPDETLVCTVDEFNRMGAAVLADKPVPADCPQVTFHGQMAQVVHREQRFTTDAGELRDFLATAAEGALTRAPVPA